jgi:hypothetical protein
MTKITIKIDGFFGTIESAWAEFVRARKENKAKKLRVLVAKHFNDLYCYGMEYVKSTTRLTGSGMGGHLPTSGNRWMCPDCNLIHAPVECSVWSGLQYPACCSTGGGHRLSHGINV